MPGSGWSGPLLRPAGLASGELFRDADFAELYCPDNGRASVAPNLLAMALLLQTHDKVSDAEAKAWPTSTYSGGGVGD